MSETDLELLARYSRQGDEDAFARVVRRHLDFVYAAALRQLHSPHLAEEVAQSTFIKLAGNAARLDPDTLLPAWLYQVTRREAVDVIRREARRQSREHLAIEMNSLHVEDLEWKRIEPVLEEAMEELPDQDRSAILLRYFERLSLREVGSALGVTDDAAQKRVSRAVERLRESFAQRGIRVSAGALGTAIAAHAMPAAPAGLALSISAAVSLTTAGIGASTFAFSKTLAMTTLQKSLLVATIAAAGISLHQTWKASSLQRQIESLQRGESGLGTNQWALEREALLAQVSQMEAELNQSRADRLEFQRLRGESAIQRRAAHGAGSEPGRAQDPVPAAAPTETAGADPLRELQLAERMANLKSSIGISQEQENALRHLIAGQQVREAEVTDRLQKSGPDAPVLGEFIQTAELFQREIEALLTDDQKAAYARMRMDEWTAAARPSANQELIEIQDVLGLSQEQQDAVFPILFQLVLQEKMRSGGGDSLVAAEHGPAPRSIREAMDRSVEERVQGLGSVLQPPQLQLYRGVITQRRTRSMQTKR